MSRTYIDIHEMEPDGKLYRNHRFGTAEVLIPSPFPSCHAADLLELPNEDLLCCWFAGSEEGNADISIVLSRLNAGSSQWTIPVTVTDDHSRSEQNPSLFLAPSGEIWLIYTAQEARTPQTPPEVSLQYTAEIRCRKSADNGYTFGPARTLFSRPGSFCRQKIQVLSNGRWVLGNWICFSDRSRNASDITVIQISDDCGKTWKSSGIPNSRGRVHANVVELGAGKLIALLRSRSADNIFLSHSDDYGSTWSEPKRTELRNNNASISAVKLRSGAVCLAYNDVSYNDGGFPGAVWPDQRCPVTVALSDDGAATWPFRRVVEPGEGFVGPWNDINNRRYEYPVIMQGGDGKIHVAYSWGTRKNIKYVCVDEAWIRGARLCQGAEDRPELPCIR